MYASVILLSVIVLCQHLGNVAPVPVEFSFPSTKQGEFARSLADYAIVTPEAVDRDGGFLSHDLSYHRRLQRRSLSGASDAAHFRISVDGDQHLLALTKNEKLLGPGFVVERKRANITNSKIRQLGHDSCHYHGHVKSRPNSKVAISDCDGLRGFIHTGNQGYFIEPVLGHDLSKNSRHPHLLYKPSDLADVQDGGQTDDGHFHGDQESQSCGVKGDGDEEDEKEEPIGERRRIRKERSVSVERNVEVLVVADKAMVEYYDEEKQDVETFVLTIMNMVSGLYHDESLGNAVNIVMVRMILMEDHENGLDISHHADPTLKSFCKWQQMINPKDDSHPNHHDIAVLLTRVNICSNMNSPCGTLGFAEVSGMCQPHRSCNINEDTGLALAFTVAHEMGHSFGMKHDGNGNDCKSNGKRPHVMSPLLTTETSPLIWSECSRKYITKFLDRGWGDCLNDEPAKHDFNYPTLPPGVMYDVAHQCRLQYGKDASYCDWMPSMCDTLWCLVGNECHSRLESAAIGTACGKPEDHKWCYAGECIEMEDVLPAISGDWGKWSEWSQCSRTCGGGVSFMERHCDNPAPKYGGKYCVGERRRYQICNTEPCDEGAPPFRAQQCSSHNSKQFQGYYYSWVPVVRDEVPCELHCKPENGFFSTKLSDTVIDGTPCSYGSRSRSMCIAGVCRDVGCDWKIASNAKEDHCGVCHGDGSSCKKIQDEFKKPSGRGYEEATVIPAGARNIRVEEVAEANNFLAVRGDTGKYYLNGHWYIQWSGEYEAAGTTIHYERNGNKEKFSAPGPTKEALHIMLLFQSENPGVAFEYTIPKNKNETTPRRLEFYWDYGDWSHCTKTCGGGTQVANPQCSERIAGFVDDNYCNMTSKPNPKQKACNVQDCPPTWWTGAWQHCSPTCGNNGTRVRSVICVRTVNNDEQVALSDEMCNVLGLEKPRHREPCQNRIPCAEDIIWLADEWSECSAECGEGIQTRTVRCKVEEHYCDPLNKPASEQRCYVDCLAAANAVDSPELDAEILLGPKPGIETFRNEHIDEVVPTVRDYDDYGEEEDPLLEGITFGEYEKYMSDGKTLDELIARRAESQKEGAAEKEDAILEYDDGVVGDDIDLFEEEEEDGNVANEVLQETTQKAPGSKPVNDVRSPSTETRNLKSTRITGSRRITDPKTSELPTDRHTTTTTLATTSQTTTSATTTLPVGEWLTGEWTQCSQTCGRGKQIRDVTCSVPHHCDHSTKPERHRHCELAECVAWIVGSWSECSVTCGTGYQSRSVKCVNVDSQEPTTGCSRYKQPTRRQTCTLSDCPAKNSAFSQCSGDRINSMLCDVIKRRGRCSSYRMQCCTTCGR